MQPTTVVPTKLAAAAVVLVAVASTACGNATAPEAAAPEAEAATAVDDRERACIERVLERDSELGDVRNHASETGPLADAVRGYIAGLDALDFAGCPADFETAFVRHRNAWESSLEFFEQHAALRGEMHTLFDEIKALGGDAEDGVVIIENGIWTTWAEVEIAARAHTEPSPDDS
jgi:hypothetical protein